jgi:hypothetical protein
MSTANAAFDPSDLTTVGKTTAGVLWYDVYATMNAIDVLGGNPYDNTSRIYSGSLDDAALNAGVKRYRASPTALANLDAYQTTGVLTKRLVTLHNLLDPVVPYWHETVYLGKVGAKGYATNLIQRTAVNPYGHCNFTTGELLAAFGAMLTP